MDRLCALPPARVAGVHRFYVGKIGTGFLYAFTRGLYGIGWIVDLILILMGRFEDADGLPLNSA